MELFDLLLKQCRQSAGYEFSQDKGDFMSGARSGIIHSQIYYKAQIEGLELKIKDLQRLYDSNKKDFVTISEIITKQQP